MANPQPQTFDKILSFMSAKPQMILLNPEKPSLLGVKQYYLKTQFFQQQTNEARKLDLLAFNEKVEILGHLLHSVSFHQCIVFVNNRDRAEWLARKLDAEGWPSKCISGAQIQQQRLQTFEDLQKFQLRILVSTDLVKQNSFRVP